ncbi:hypothetical protein JZO78_12405 [Enterococcus ureilyticus]|uniref:lectin like domain-containing protein n=1 Tax=Enterococcus ureilyticus TaxID=1131292 RepID=UPI001A92483B|nr:C1 family peptidase [Enterococcus ureilyticus]MBO0447144.1 hypothetical protein [Enterococcus ureilyticus]
MKKRLFKQSGLLLFSVLFLYPSNEVLASPPTNGVIPDNSPAIEQPKLLERQTRTTLPRIHDPRTTNNLAVKNQGSLNICWAFASNAALEHHYEKKNGTPISLSERHSDYFFARNATSILNENPLAYNRNLGAGGQEAATFYSSIRWKSPVLEKDMPFQLSLKPLSLIDLDKPTPFHVQGIVDIPKLSKDYTNSEQVARVNEIKKETLTNGGVTFRNNGKYLQSTNAHYNAKTDSYFTAIKNNPSAINHVCLIVGWDDNFSKNNFSTPPSQNGAFIVKNSWGTSYNDGGYFYVSYEDYHLMTNDSHAISSIENNNNYEHQYSKTDFITPSTESSYSIDSPHYYLSNNYDAPKNNHEIIKAIGIRTVQYNTPYEIYINPNGTENKNLKNLIKVAEGIKESPGFETVRLKEHIPIYSKDKFSVVIKFKRPDGVALAYFPAEFTWISDKVDVSNQSFYSSSRSDTSLNFQSFKTDFYIHVYTDDLK